MFARSLRLTAVPSALRAACAPSSSAPAVAGALVAVRHKSAEALSYTERQALKGRPISPHVMIYAFPIVALSSITVRVTGALLAVGTSGIGIMALAGGASRRGHAASACRHRGWPAPDLPAQGSTVAAAVGHERIPARQLQC